MSRNLWLKIASLCFALAAGMRFDIAFTEGVQKDYIWATIYLVLAVLFTFYKIKEK